MIGLIFKVIGGVIIILASTSIGAILARGCSSRVYNLRTVQNCLREFENEVVFMSNPVAEAFIKISQNLKNPVSLIFRDTAETLLQKKGFTAFEAWKDAINKNSINLSLSAEDISILLDFGKMLGSSDRNGQVSNINLTAEKLKIQENKAEERRRKFESMYRKLGVLGGLAVVVLLF